MSKQSTVRIGIDKALFMSALEEFGEEYEDKLKDKCFEVAQRLAEEIGQPVAQVWFGSEVKVTAKPIGKKKNGYKIIANGKDVCFLEFGAGVTTDTTHPFAKNVSFDVYPASWSIDHAKQFVRKGYWMYRGEKYDAITPMRGMYHAYKAILEEAPRIVEEVFRT